MKSEKVYITTAEVLSEFEGHIVTKGAYNKKMALFGILPEDTIDYTVSFVFSKRLPIYMHAVEKHGSFKSYFVFMAYRPTVEVICVIPTNDSNMLAVVLTKMKTKIKGELE